MHCLIKNKKEELVYLIAFICTVVVSMVLFVYWGNGKRVTFCDEIYTYNIVNSDGLTPYEINKWMSGDDFKNALTHGNDDYYEKMIDNIKMDKVHPPLYYILVYIASKLAGDTLSVWTALAVNLFAYLGTGCIVFFILKKLFHSPVLSSLGTIGVLMTQCMLSAGMLARMYMVYTFFTALFVYANVLASDKKADVARSRGAILAEIAKYLLLCAAVVGGFLTQYYFVFFVAAFFGFEIIYDIKEKRFRDILKYAVALAVAAVFINKLWDYWYVAITSNAHSAGVIGNAKEIFEHLGSIYYGYKLVIMYVFQKAYKAFLILFPVIAAVFYVVARGRENSYIRSVVTRIAGAALMYAFVVNVLTPEALSSTRYYYADMLLVLLAYIICVFAIFDKIIKKGGKVKRLYMTAVGICIIALNVILLISGFGVDYYPDTGEYDETTGILESYSDIPWIIGWEPGWMIDTAMFDYTIPDRIIPMNINAQVEAGTFDGVDEFILAQCNAEDSEQVTQKNLYNYIMDTGKNVEAEKIASRGYVSFYYCRAAVDDGKNKETVDNFIEQNSDILWLVIDNDGWYDAEKIFPDGEPEKLIFIDRNTQHDVTGKYSDCGRAAILMSVYGDDVKDVGLYYLIGSTGKFFQGTYVGTADNGAVVIYQCDVVE